MVVRYSKILLVASIGFLTTLIALNNVQDYGSNLLYVQHVLSMDTTFPNNQLLWRAIKAPELQNLAYWLMILTEITISGLCWWGSFKLLRGVGASAQTFHQAKDIAILGLTLGFLFWFVGFMAIGGEWFAMWQSPDWNGQQPAFRFIGCVGIVLLFLNSQESDLTR